MRIFNTGLSALVLMLIALAPGCSVKTEMPESELLKADKILYCSPDQLPIFKLALTGDTIFSYSRDKDWAFEIVTMYRLLPLVCPVAHVTCQSHHDIYTGK